MNAGEWVTGVLTFHVSAAKIAFPRRFEEIKLRDRDWDMASEGLSRYMKLIKKKGADFNAISEVGKAKILFPKHTEELRKLLPLDKAGACIKKFFSSPHSIYCASSLKLLYSEKPIDYMSEAELEARARVFIQNSYNSKDWHRLAEDFASYKLLFPHKKIPIELTEELWWNLGNKLEEYRISNDVTAFITLARNMRLLSAKEIKITDTSFEVIMPLGAPELKEDIPKLPVIRKF